MLSEKRVEVKTMIAYYMRWQCNTGDNSCNQQYQRKMFKIYCISKSTIKNKVCNFIGFMRMYRLIVQGECIISID